MASFQKFDSVNAEQGHEGTNWKNRCLCFGKGYGNGWWNLKCMFEVLFIGMYAKKGLNVHTCSLIHVSWHTDGRVKNLETI